ncbi:MAG: zf-HC2 domain-containing protein [Planctomycetota bacterium]|nr:zf-HC2 domain-containing protein [Planctomycetota bacterium]
MSHCERTKEFDAYHDGELSPERARALEEHLGQCPVCEQELRELQELTRSLRGVELVSLPTDALRRLEDRAVSRYTSEAATTRMAVWLTAVAAAVVISGLAMLWRSSGRDDGYSPPEFTLDRFAASESLYDVAEAPPDPEVELAFWVVGELSSQP